MADDFAAQTALDLVCTDELKQILAAYKNKVSSNGWSVMSHSRRMIRMGSAKNIWHSCTTSMVS